MWCQGPLIFYLISSTYLPTTTYQTTNYLRSPYFCQQALLPTIFQWFPGFTHYYGCLAMCILDFVPPARMTVIGMYVFAGEQIIKPGPGLISQWLAIIDDSESDQSVISTSALSRIRIWYFSISPIPRIPSSHFYSHAKCKILELNSNQCSELARVQGFST